MSLLAYAPETDPQGTPVHAGDVVIYCVIEMANSGSEPFPYDRMDFCLCAKDESWPGSDDGPRLAVTEPPLVSGTLEPGETVRGAVAFEFTPDAVPTITYLHFGRLIKGAICWIEWSAGDTADPAAVVTTGVVAPTIAADALSSSTEAPPATILDLVQPVGVMQQAGDYRPEQVIMSEEAERFTPPSEMFVYRIRPTEPRTREGMDALATKLGIGEEYRTYGEAGLSGTHGSLICPRSDDLYCFSYNYHAPIDAAFEAILAGYPPEPVSEEEARAIADAYLEALDMMDGYEFGGVGESCVYGTMGPQGEDLTWVVEMGVGYRAFVEGVPVTGPGAEVSVTIGPEGVVTSFYHFAQQVTKTEYAVTIRPVEEALADLEAGEGDVPGNLDDRDKTITVEDIEMFYYAPAATPSLHMHYKPVYVFSVRGNDGSIGRWVLPAFEGSTAEGAI